MFIKIIKLLRYLITKWFTLKTKFLKPVFLKNKITKEINGYKMNLYLKNDTGLSRDLHYYGVREINSVLILENIIKKGDTVLDIGANVGYFALLESRLVGDNGTVYAIEPVKKNFVSLKENIKLNNYKNIETFNLAAGDTEKESYINVGKKGNLSSIIERDEIEFEDKQDIKITKIDNFIEDKKKPNLVRMDVEGYEYAVIKGTSETLRNKNIKILMEIHPFFMSNDQLETMFETLENSGFNKCLLIYEPYLPWLNNKHKIRTTIKYLTNIIGDNYKLGGRKYMSVTDLLRYIINNKKLVHVLLYK